MGRNWAFGKHPVLFKRWTPLFDANREKVDKFPVWVRAPGFPPFLWVESVFKSIGNLLGTYLETDMSYIHTHNKAMARILVSVNPREGLAESINLQYKDLVYEQPLDYEHLPFRCHRCHEYGHLARYCLLDNRRRRTQKTVEQEEKVAELKRVSGTEKLQEEDSMDVDINQEGKSKEPALEGPPGRKEAVEDHRRSKNLIKEPNNEPTIIIIEDSNGMQLDSSNPSLFPLEIKDACLIPGFKINNCNLDEQLNVDNIIAVIPSLDLNCDDDPNKKEDSVPSSSVCHYNLRSLDKKLVILDSIGGLGLTSPQTFKRKARGRKSNLSKAQVKANFDVADGKQMSIPGALRAVNPYENVIK